ncbi:hypothetical protein J8F10_02090 [Gemmata sp. G18]|uniref:Uncharacterized protein n=1 Tax=Gemmata palustris TaxID=2822762 RepID=A0ABS5BK56_9BACT|nr:hypothetical protein [Gemmata palustris]MBP3954086.1 hypothetical protein [Gemmata palustris]
MFITVHLAPVGARNTARDDQRARIATDIGVTLEPLHPGTTDPDLAGQFFADVPDASADDICARLLANSAVVAAYPKPADGPPSTGTL